MAVHTLIFLGPCNKTTENSLKQALRNFDKAILFEAENELKSAIQQLLDQPWFNRVWILQELVLSRDPHIQYGYLRLSWDKFFAFMSWVLGRPLLGAYLVDIAAVEDESKDLETVNSVSKGFPVDSRTSADIFGDAMAGEPLDFSRCHTYSSISNDDVDKDSFERSLSPEESGETPHEHSYSEESDYPI
ncbi:uncharacterized protein BP5553_08828 [Venustampulla echinocandica]|uniref:Heterokaryon incompatibility domain-containing protein n=1 Tax=Venustampulla echinocandica TaxID=2656787 RepID=A0A370TD35_9HELO|nr:uncharacterized protein BP5553_08828 [Venustampulla echinocandica]RDL32372.1 hypothetical protein BP5553_08828 [Venustampulla echinocandica]